MLRKTGEASDSTKKAATKPSQICLRAFIKVAKYKSQFYSDLQLPYYLRESIPVSIELIRS